MRPLRKRLESFMEIIDSNFLPICPGDNYKIYAAGREDIDVMEICFTVLWQDRPNDPRWFGSIRELGFPGGQPGERRGNHAYRQEKMDEMRNEWATFVVNTYVLLGAMELLEG